MGQFRKTVVLVCLVGCKFHSPTAAGDAGDDDGAVTPDVPDAPDAPADCLSWNAKNFDPCAIGSPMPDPGMTSAGSPYTYDTTDGGGVLTDKVGTTIFTSPATTMQTDSTVVAVMNVESFVMPPNVELHVVGSKPLIIASWSMLEVGGTIDAGSYTAETDGVTHADTTIRAGAGSDPAGCNTAFGSPGTDHPSTTGGSGGGGGGAHAGAGGAGAIGDSNVAILGGPGGTAITTPNVIRGGCRGGASGKAGAGAQAPATSASVANPGSGGGAIQLAARQALRVPGSGIVNAGGGGGGGAPQGTACGGGGGGSGGYIGLDAPTVVINGTIAANGGGGGASSPFAGFGVLGENALMGAAAAQGGTHHVGGGSTCGLAGAVGGAGATTAGSTATGMDSCGGGAGGGGVGFVLVWGVLDKTNSTISPAEQLNAI
jgi:hypothetical protein